MRFGLDQVWWLVSPGNPLKQHGPAPLSQRVAQAQTLMQHPRVKITALGARMQTRFTAQTLRGLTARYPGVRFVWLMGADNLAQFDQWKNWRGIARTLPIAVIARPGYDDDALASPAMAWLRRFEVPATRLKNAGEWRGPALIMLRFDPDPSSATAIRRGNPDWAAQYVDAAPRDAITHHIIGAEDKPL